jgi:Fur family zinc uptake transcriptional regulator
MADGRHHSHDHGPCAHATDRSAHARESLARAEALCSDRGARLTPIRREVLEALHATHRPLGAYDIADLLMSPERRRLAPITIYRALDFLIEHGLVHRLASRNAFVACPHGHAPQDIVAFLICEECGGVDEMCSTELSAALGKLTAAEGFAPSAQVLEISGRCSHCREAA